MLHIDPSPASLFGHLARLDQPSRPRHHRPRRGLAVEALEERALLSTWTVNSLGDAGAGVDYAGDLRYVITEVDKTTGDNIIKFSVTGTITLNSALPELSNTSGLTDIQGPGASVLTVARCSDFGTPDFRILTIDAGVQAKLDGLTITGGHADNGGGISNAGTVTIDACAISGNSVGDGVGGAGIGGGIVNSGTMTLIDSAVTGNRTGNDNGGGIANSGAMTLINSSVTGNIAGIDSWGDWSVDFFDYGGGDGGGVYNSGTMTLTNSTVSDNTSSPRVSIGGHNAWHWGGDGGGIYNGSGTVFLTNSTVARNSSGDTGGGISNGSGTVSLTSSTVAANQCSGAQYSGGGGGGIYNGSGTVSLVNSTVAANQTHAWWQGGGGGIHNDSGTVSLSTSIVAGNSAPVILPQDGMGAFNSLGHNLIGNTEGTSGWDETDLLNVDPMLGPLQDNGGPTMTMALVLSSPAVDAAAPVESLTTDQRGVSRTAYGPPDIGAFELENAGPRGTLSINEPAYVDEPVTVQFRNAYDPSPIGPGTDLHYAFATDPTALVGATYENSSAIPTANFTFSTVGERTVYGRVIAQDNDYNDYSTHFGVYYQPGTPVVNTNDSGTGSLRDVIQYSSPGSQIFFDSRLRGQTITLTSGELVIDKSLDIEGLGASVLTVARSSDLGTPDFRIFMVNAGVNAKLDGLTITGGKAENGGGIYSDWRSTLSIDGCTISGNSGSGIGSNGTLTITTSTIRGNSGGGIGSSGTSTIDACTISGNSGSGIRNNGTSTVDACTISGNSASGYSAGGGIDNGGAMTINACTISGNSASGDSAGGYVGGGIDNEGAMTINACTISGNWVSGGYWAGGGICIDGGTVAITNTIVALNTSWDLTANEISGWIDTANSYHNLIGVGWSGGLSDGDNGNMVGVIDAMLGPLQDNGGPTWTMAPLTGSPAIDVGGSDLPVNPITGQLLTTDQRGDGFSRLANGKLDIGAVEVQTYISAVSVIWGGQTAFVQTAGDGLRLLPNGRQTDLPWMDIQQLQVNLTQPAALVASDISVVGESGNYGVSLSGSGTSYTITLSKPIDAADRVMITIGNALIAGFTRRLDVLPGDVNDDGVVSAQDMVLIRNAIQKIGDPLMIGWADVDGNGIPDVNDYMAARKKLGSRLPQLAS